MGQLFSQESKLDAQDKESSLLGTPKISSLAKVFTFIDDPRSPGKFSRTPILVQDNLNDPRSPCNELVERTPIYASTPVIRYKMDNEGYQPSPGTPAQGKIVEDENDEEFVNIMEDNEIVGEINHGINTSIAGTVEESKYDCQLSNGINNVSEKSNELASEGGRALDSHKNNLLKRRSGSKSNPLLRTVLFKPYQELNESENVELNRESSPQKMPLGTKNIICSNENTSNIKKINVSSDCNPLLHRLSLENKSIYDKENVVF